MLKAENVIAIDPGAHGVGLSVIVARELALVRYVKGGAFNAKKEYASGMSHISALSARVWETLDFENRMDNRFKSLLDKGTVLVLEWPQVYVPRRSNPYQVVGEAASLLWLAAVNGAIAANWAGNVYMVHPHDWKKNVPTEKVLPKRIMQELSETEKEVLIEGLQLCPKNLQHNIWDAVGIDLFGAGRGVC